MPIQFPQLDHSRLLHFSVCAVLPAKTRLLSKHVPKEGTKHADAKYGSRSRTCFIQAFTDRFPDNRFHLHVNVATPRYFDGEAPKKLDAIDDVESLIEPFTGKKAELVFIRARYEVKKSSLPERGLVRGLVGMKTIVSDERLELVGANFSISGSPYDSLEWATFADTDKVGGRLCASLQNATLDDDYLVSALYTIDAGIDRFLLEEEPT